MSKMFVVSIDDNKKADEFLRSLQEHKTVAYPDARGAFHKAPVLFIYVTDSDGNLKGLP